MASYTTIVLGDDATAKLVLGDGQAPMLAISDGESHVVITLAGMHRDRARDVVDEISGQVEWWSYAVEAAALRSERRAHRRGAVAPVPGVPGVAS